MFANPSTFQQPNQDKIFTIEENQKKKKRKSFSFCMNEENMKDAAFLQNYFNSEIPMQQSNPDNKSSANQCSRARG